MKSRQQLAAGLVRQWQRANWREQQLLPFARQRVPTTELHVTPLADSHIPLVENARCLHQLSQPLPDTIAILGAWLNQG